MDVQPVPSPQRSIRFGLFQPQFRTDAQTMIATAQVAEQAGFDSFWLMDHLLAPGAPPCDVLESWTLLTALAMTTSRIRLGHLVGCNPFRHPSLLAKMAATLDQLSAGRLELGLGWGSVEDELAAFGFAVGSRRQRSRALGETVEILRLMFDGSVFDYAGDVFQLRGAYGLPKPVQPRIPLHIGGSGRTLTMPLVARHADWWNCVGSARHELDELVVLAEGARISAQYPVGMLDREADRAEVTAAVARRLPAAAWGQPLIGTPAELVAQLLTERARGVELFVLRFHDFAPSGTLRRFGAEVIEPLHRLLGV